MEEKDKQLADEISKQVIDGVKKEMPKFSLGRSYNIIKDAITIALVILVVIFALNLKSDFKKNFSVNQIEGHDLTLENHGFLGNTTVDFKEAIMGEATKKALLIVQEQDVSVTSVIINNGLFNLGIFEKSQTVIYGGTAQFTVNLEELKESEISVDDENHTITVTVPKVELHDVSFEPSRTQFANVERGWLAFGDMKFTPEQQNQIEIEAKNRLTEEAKESVYLEKAEKNAKYVLRDFFETAIDKVSKSYKVKIEFEQ